jgi:CubicO group peptidase (beta-lactamase class C family)
MDERHIPGVSLAVVKDGATIKSAAYGRMRLAPDEPAAPTTIYKLDSVTKQFTASGVMLLVQAGRVCLDQPVRTYLPNAPGSWDAITIRNLLTHTSGLAHDPPSGYAVLDTDRVLTAESKRAMWSPFRLTDGRWHPYGFAWAVRELPGGKVVFHNGAGDGFNNAFYRFLDARLTVIVLTNLNPSRRHGSHADALARRIAALYDPALVFPERHHPPLNQPS